MAQKNQTLLNLFNYANDNQRLDFVYQGIACFFYREKPYTGIKPVVYLQESHYFIVLNGFIWARKGRRSLCGSGR
jgi:hypothetical protein